MKPEHYRQVQRRNKIRKLYNLLKEKKDTLGLNQILALFRFLYGTTPETVEEYLNDLTESGIIRLNDGKIVEIIDLKKKLE